jgi:epoxide hydrolase-like predicted phosphatase
MTSQREIKAVILDVGGVLDCAADPAAEEASRRQLAAELGLDLDEMWRLFFQTEPWYLARVGEITDADLWNRNLAPLGIVDPARQAAFLDRLFAYKQVTPAMRALLRDLHGRVKLGIISNASDKLESLLEEQLDVERLFDVVINSARVGVAKPDPEIYSLALARLDVAPEEAVFTDDQQHNVDAAAELGIHAVLFTGAEAFRTYLVELGILES